MRSVPLLFLAVLAGCTPPPPGAIVLEPPSEPPPGIDGRYRGTARLVRADTATCPRSGSRVYEVRNGQVTLSYNAGPRQRMPLTADIGGDGRFQASDGVGTMEGTLQDERLEISIASQFCEHRWTLTRVN